MQIIENPSNLHYTGISLVASTHDNLLIEVMWITRLHLKCSLYNSIVLLQISVGSTNIRVGTAIFGPRQP